MVLVLRGANSVRGRRFNLVDFKDGKLVLEGISNPVSPITVEIGEEELTMIQEHAPEILENFDLRQRFGSRYYFMSKKNEVSKRPL